VAIATERITGQFCQLIASNAPDTTSRMDSPVTAIEDRRRSHA
jgi:hypothetical protein